MLRLSAVDLYQNFRAQKLSVPAPTIDIAVFPAFRPAFASAPSPAQTPIFIPTIAPTMIQTPTQTPTFAFTTSGICFCEKFHFPSNRSHNEASTSEAIRQSPLGLKLTLPIFGPPGIQSLLYC